MAKLKDVAELAGVSITTVSSILNVAGGSDRFSESCIAKVRKAADELGYAVNHHSRSLRTGQSQVIGISLCAPRELKGRLGWYRSEMIAGALWACADHEYELMMISEPGQNRSFERGLKYLQQKKIDGLIVGSPVNFNSLEGLEDCKGAIAMCRYGFETHLPNFIADVEMGGDLMLSHLTGLGHRRIAFLCPENMAEVPMAMGRFAEVEQWCKTKGALLDGFELDYVPVWNLPMAKGFVEAQNYTRNMCLDMMAEGKYTAYLCWSEIIAHGVYKAARMKDIRIPEDISVACFYDIFARYSSPGLTAVNYRESEMTHRAGEFLIANLLDNSDFDEFRGMEVKIEPALMVRPSTAAPLQK